MKIGILGSGTVARTLAAGFDHHGHDVMLGTRDPAKLESWLGEHPDVSAGSVADAATFGDVIVLAVKGIAAEAVVRAAGEDALSGKVVIDTTNPIADAPPENGVLRFFTGLDESLMERLQAVAPLARFVKSFSCVGAPLMVNPSFEGGPATMFICGNDASARATVHELLDQFGWEIADMGGAEAARAIEPLCILWCIPGFLRNEWSHALKLVR